MSLQPSKYKVLTKQVYNHLIDEHGYQDMTIKYIMNEIRTDELLTLLLKKVSRIEKVEIAFMVYFFSETKDLESSFSRVRGNLINIGMYHYSNLGTRMESCHNCYGEKTQYCYECDGRGDVDCGRCDGNGTEECRNCDGTGEVDGEPCSDCQGNGEIGCSWCDGEGESQCRNCDGYGSVDCDYCDGNGEYESNEEYYTEEEIDYFGLNRNLTRLPEDTILDENQVDMIFKSKPHFADFNVVDDTFPSWKIYRKYEGNVEGSSSTVINNIYEIN